MLAEHGLARVAAIEGVQRGGAELQPQRDEAGDADDPGEQRDPAVPVAGPAKPAQQAVSLAGMRGARQAGVRHGDLPRAEGRLSLPILAIAGAKVVVPGEAPKRAGTPRTYSPRSTRPASAAANGGGRRPLTSSLPPGDPRALVGRGPADGVDASVVGRR